jgi:hypothetical protein
MPGTNSTTGNQQILYFPSHPYSSNSETTLNAYNQAANGQVRIAPTGYPQTNGNMLKSRPSTNWAGRMPQAIPTNPVTKEQNLGMFIAPKLATKPVNPDKAAPFRSRLSNLGKRPSTNAMDPSSKAYKPNGKNLELSTAMQIPHLRVSPTIALGNASSEIPHSFDQNFISETKPSGASIRAARMAKSTPGIIPPARPKLSGARNSQPEVPVKSSNPLFSAVTGSEYFYDSVEAFESDIANTPPYPASEANFTPPPAPSGHRPRSDPFLLNSGPFMQQSNYNSARSASNISADLLNQFNEETVSLML